MMCVVAVLLEASGMEMNSVSSSQDLSQQVSHAAYMHTLKPLNKGQLRGSCVTTAPPILQLYLRTRANEEAVVIAPILQ